MYLFLLLLTFLFFFLVGIQKLRLAFKIFTNEAQLDLFNSVVALCLTVSGKISKTQLIDTFDVLGKYLFQGLLDSSHSLSLFGCLFWEGIRMAS